MGPELLNKYIWLVQKFVTAGDRGMDLDEISRAWFNKFGSEYPRRTFNNHREAVREVFGILIECDRSTNRYMIRRSGDVSDAQANTAWLIDTFTVNGILSLARERLSGRVSVEAIPSGRKYLATLMNAMQENNIVEIVYRRYGEEPRTHRVHPYAVKENSLRWYLIGHSEDRGCNRIYSLDRIQEMKVLPETFAMPENFDVDELFATSFGTYLSETPGRTIQFRAYGQEVLFLRDLPIHSSQVETSTGEDSSTFSIFVSPNRSMYLEFLRHGPYLEILSPADVREKMEELTRRMADMYTIQEYAKTDKI